jgi:hypothetical protein
LRPAPEDIAILERAVWRWHMAQSSSSVSALLLGVTAEIASLRWPRAVRLIAADHSLAMIRGLWPGAALGFPALCAEWDALPLGDASQDLVAGDGCLSTLIYPGGYESVVRELGRVVRAGGMLALRFFTRPAISEPLDAAFADLRAGRIGNFHVFKWRLAMALHGTLEQGVRLADIWNAWHAQVPDPGALSAQLGWPLPAVLTIDVYREVATRYTFPTLAEVRAVLSGAFAEVECTVPRYELGERCPTVIFARR